MTTTTEPAYSQALRVDCAAWQSEIDNLDAQVSELQKKRGKLIKKIHAAHVLLASAERPSPPAEPPPAKPPRQQQHTAPAAPGAAAAAKPTPAPTKPLGETIVAMMVPGRTYTAAQIRAGLVDAEAGDEISLRGGHFYGVLKRLIEEGALNRTDDGGYRKAAIGNPRTPGAMAREGNMTAELMGDPTPGRSALAKRADATAAG